MSALDPCLAVVPARGGSKGLPGKNIRPLLGLPLLVHSLRCARLCPRIARVIVSTDDAEIANVARAHGGDVPFLRPAELAADDTPMMPVLTHALEEIERAEGRRYGSLMLLDPTSPGRTPDDVTRAFAALDADSAAAGILAVSRPTFNPFWVGVIEKDGAIGPAFPDAFRFTRRQDVPTFYRVNGALYLWRRDFIAGRPARATDGRQLMVEIPEARAFSIDDAQEFALAEAILERKLINLPWLDEPTKDRT
jgi:CMP-N,N'-diacetyllegionaminic acid synthase